MRRSLLPIALATTAIIAACGGGGQEETASQGNVFQNPGLEEGRDPWFSLREPEFILSEDIARTGKASASCKCEPTLRRIPRYSTWCRR